MRICKPARHLSVSRMQRPPCSVEWVKPLPLTLLSQREWQRGMRGKKGHWSAEQCQPNRVNTATSWLGLRSKPGNFCCFTCWKWVSRRSSHLRGSFTREPALRGASSTLFSPHFLSQNLFLFHVGIPLLHSSVSLPLRVTSSALLTRGGNPYHQQSGLQGKAQLRSLTN